MIVDAGGQRTQRRKWIYCFENVTTILFIVALSEFDHGGCLTPDSGGFWRGQTESGAARQAVPVGRGLEESKQLFKSIVTGRWFWQTSVILFLNKYDIFREKIEFGTNRLSDYYPDYRGSDRDPMAGAQFILDQFYQLDPDRFRKRVLYSHFTCATDTGNIRLVFQAVKDTILEQLLRREIQIF